MASCQEELQTLNEVLVSLVPIVVICTCKLSRPSTTCNAHSCTGNCPHIDNRQHNNFNVYSVLKLECSMCNNLAELAMRLHNVIDYRMRAAIAYHTMHGMESYPL